MFLSPAFYKTMPLSEFLKFFKVTWLNHSFGFFKIYHSHSEKIIAKSL